MGIKIQIYLVIQSRPNLYIYIFATIHLYNITHTYGAIRLFHLYPLSIQYTVYITPHWIIETLSFLANR